MQIGRPSSATTSGDHVDVQALLRSMGTDPRPRLTWYSTCGDRVELTGRDLVRWVAKTAHLLLEEGDVAPGTRVRVSLGPDWRAPVFWTAAWFLGADVHDDGGSVWPATVPDDATDGAAGGAPGGAAGGAPGGAAEGAAADVHVRAEGATGRPTGAVEVVVAATAMPRPLTCPVTAAVDYGAEAAGHPDVLPAPGPASVVRVAPRPAGRTLLGPPVGATDVLACWGAGGSVVLHTGLEGEALARVRTQENVGPA